MAKEQDRETSSQFLSDMGREGGVIAEIPTPIVRVATQHDLAAYGVQQRTELGNAIPQEMLPRTTEKAASVTPYIIETGSVPIGTVDFYDPIGIMLATPPEGLDCMSVDLNSLRSLRRQLAPA